MASSAQLECRQAQRLFHEGAPSRLVCRVSLAGGEAFSQRCRAQGPKEWATRGAARWNEYDCANPQRCGRQPVLRTPQVDLELLHAAASANDCRMAYGGGDAGICEKPQRVGTNVQEVCNASCQHALGADQYAVHGQEIQALQQAVQGKRRLARAART